MSTGYKWRRENAARLLSLASYAARKELPSSARVCPICRHVFVPAFANDRRCDGCAAAASEKESARL